jgi:hypothetical protein
MSTEQNRTRRLISLSWPCEVKDGQLLAPRARITKEVGELKDCPEAVLILKPLGQKKTLDQLAAFHGPIVEQVQKFYEDFEGVYKSADRIKHDLKEQFLIREKRYWDDGSPVILNIAHPTKPGVKMQWHLQELPSLEALTIDQFRGFITAIIDWFWHERGYRIEIDPLKKKTF